MDFWHLDIDDQIITQAEAYAALLARSAYSTLLQRRRCIIFVDNESARFSLIKGASPSRTLLMIAVLFHDLESQDEAIMWIETAPSASKIADLPSRGLVSEAAQVVKGRVRVLDEASIRVANLCQACDDLPWDLLSRSAGKSLPTFFVKAGLGPRCYQQSTCDRWKGGAYGSRATYTLPAQALRVVAGPAVGALALRAKNASDP